MISLVQDSQINSTLNLEQRFIKLQGLQPDRVEHLRILNSRNNDIIASFDAFINDRQAQNLSDGTIIFYRTKIKLFLKYTNPLGVKNVSDLTPHLIRDYFIHLEQENHSPGGVHAAFRSLKAFLNWYKEEYEPDNWKNPIDKVKAPKVPLEILEPVESDAALDLLKACNQKTIFGLRDYAIILTLMDTGVRASELLSINLNDLDLSNGRIIIKKGKGNKFRIVFVSNITRNAILNYLKRRSDNLPSLWLNKAKGNLKYFGLRQIIRRRSDQAKIKTPPLHGFRRLFALQMLRSGVDIFSLQKLMGHADIQILRRYLQQTEEDIHSAHQLGGPVNHLLFKSSSK